MKNRLILMFLLTSFLGVCNIESMAQEIYVPEPIFHLAFDSNDPGYESVSNKTYPVHGKYNQVVDRFGNSGRGVRFTEAGAGIECPKLAVKSVNTVSFWTYVFLGSKIPEGPKPFAETERTVNFYNWTDASGNILRGTAQRGPTVGFNRFITKDDGTRVPWYLWAYAPAEFDEVGWYHIFVVQGQHFTRLIMYKPSNKKVYAYNWLGAQSFDDRANLQVGGFANYYGADTGFDDFKVYNAALTDDQVDYMHTVEYPMDKFLKVRNRYSLKFVTVQNASMEDNVNVIQHTNGTGNNVWKLQRGAGPDECRLFNLHSNKVLAIKNASTATGAEIVQRTSNGSEDEVWKLEYSIRDPRYFRLKNKLNGKYLYVAGNSMSNDVKLLMGNPGEETAYWHFELTEPYDDSKLEPGLYRFKNKKSGKYLDVYGQSTNDGAKLVQAESSWRRNTNLWELSPGYANGVYLKNIVSNLFMDGSNDYYSGSAITQSVNTQNNRDIWQLIKVGSKGKKDYYKLRNAHNYMYAVVRDASTEENAEVIQYSTADTDNALWIPERYYYNDSPVKHGWFEIQNMNSSKLMAVAGGANQENAPLVQKTKGGKEVEFEVVEHNYGLVTLQNVNSGKYVAVENASLEENARIIQSSIPTSPNTFWRVLRSYTPMESGYELTNLKSGLVLSVSNMSTAENAPIVQSSSPREDGTWLFNMVPQPRNMLNAETLTDIQNPTLQQQIKVQYSKGKILIDNLSSKSLALSLLLSDVVGQTYCRSECNLLSKERQVILIDELKAGGVYLLQIEDKESTERSIIKFVNK